MRRLLRPSASAARLLRRGSGDGEGRAVSCFLQKRRKQKARRPRRRRRLSASAALALDLLPRFEEEARERMLAGKKLLDPPPTSEEGPGEAAEKAAETVGIGRTAKGTGVGSKSSRSQALASQAFDDAVAKRTEQQPAQTATRDPWNLPQPLPWETRAYQQIDAADVHDAVPDSGRFADRDGAGRARTPRFVEVCRSHRMRNCARDEPRRSQHRKRLKADEQSASSHEGPFPESRRRARARGEPPVGYASPQKTRRARRAPPPSSIVLARRPARALGPCHHVAGSPPPLPRARTPALVPLAPPGRGCPYPGVHGVALGR